MSTLLQDIRYALRILRKSPGFSVVAVLTLALGTGATTAMFSVLNQGLLHPLPYPQPNQLVKLNWISPGNNVWDDLNAMQAKYFTENSRTLQSAGMLFPVPGCNLSAAGKPEYVRQSGVSTGFFPTLGIQPISGRNFVAEDVGPAGLPHTAILSYELWRSHFGADPNVLGETIYCNGLSYAVVGILPRGFSFIEDPADIWIPDSLANHIRDNGANYFTIARLKDGVSIEQARQEMLTLAPVFRKEFHNYTYTPRPEYMGLDQYSEARTVEYRQSILFLFGAVALVMLIACANVASLVLARANARTREIAVRIAIGASRGRILRQLLTETFILNLLGGAAGVILLVWSLAPLNAVIARKFPVITQLHIDAPVLIFALAASLLAAVFSGLAPAIQASRGDVNVNLRQQTNSSEGGAQQRRRKLLVVGEVGLAVVLLVASTLLLRSFLALRSVSPGLNAENLQVTQLFLSSPRYQSTAEAGNFLREVERRVRALPGVTSMAAISGVPTQRGLYLTAKAGDECSDPGKSPGIQYRPISAAYMKTVGIPVLAGRDFQEHESAPVALVNETLVRRCFKAREALGDEITATMHDIPRQVVGIVGDTRDFGLATPPRPTIYVPVEQTPDTISKFANGIFRWAIVVRTQQRQNLGREIEQAVVAVDSQQPVIRTGSMEELFGDLLASSRLMVEITALFTGVGLLLTAIGLYGLLSYSIVQRTREIGIRMALGAARSDVLRMVVREGMILVVIGAAAGAVASLAGNRVMSSLLFRLKPLDPVSFGIAIVVLLAVALLASYLPARRATRIDPLIALRYE